MGRQAPTEGRRVSSRRSDDDDDNDYGGTDNEVEVDDGRCDESAIAETPNSGWFARSGRRSLSRLGSRPLITEKAWCFDEFKSFLVTCWLASALAKGFLNSDWNYHA